MTTTRVAEQVAAFHGVEIEWTTDLRRRSDRSPPTSRASIFAGDGRGGFVVPEFGIALDGIAAFVRLVGLVARTQLRSPRSTRGSQSPTSPGVVPTPWAAKGMVMRAVVEAAGDRELDTTDGVRVVEPDGRWALVLPDPAEPVTHLWAEAPTHAAVDALLDEWTEVVERAGQ